MSQGDSLGQFLALVRTTCAVAFALALSACGSGNFVLGGKLGSASLSSSDGENLGPGGNQLRVGDKVELDVEVLRTQGTAPTELTGQGQQTEGLSAINPSYQKLRLAAGTKLTAVIDNECSARKPTGFHMQVKSAAGTPTELDLQAYGITLTTDTDLDKLADQANSDECIVQIANDADMKAVAAPNDTQFGSQWHHTSLETAAAMDKFGASAGIKTATVIAIVDSGVNYNHEDLSGNMWSGPGGIRGRNFVNGTNDPMDDNGHGTHCAGLVAAVTNNSLGVAGVADNFAKIMAVKVLDSTGEGSTTAIVNGITYAVENGANVISLSFGSKGTNAALRAAIANALNRGVTVLMAAGNDGVELTNTNWYSPASYSRELTGAIAVGAISTTAALANYSNFSPEYVELGAPGSSVISTLQTGYGPMTGTSMSAPIAAGAAALAIGQLKSRGVMPTPALIEQLLMDGSSKVAALTGAFRGGNRLNLKTLADVIDSRYPVNAPPSTTTNTECGHLTGVACEVFLGVNAERVKAGLSALKPLSKCTTMAVSHSTDMATNNFFSHTSPTQGTFTNRAPRFGLSGYSGENIAYGYDAKTAITAWMNSEGHKANILGTNYRSTGIGVVLNSAGKPYYTQCFSSLPGE